MSNRNSIPCEAWKKYCQKVKYACAYNYIDVPLLIHSQSDPNFAAGKKLKYVLLTLLLSACAALIFVLLHVEYIFWTIIFFGIQIFFFCTRWHTKKDVTFTKSHLVEIQMMFDIVTSDGVKKRCQGMEYGNVL